jgi:hypothetical protein
VYIPLRLVFRSLKWWVALLIALTGGLPDLIPAVQTLQGNWSGPYHWCHSSLWWRDALMPTWGLHLLLDSLCHKPTGGWYEWTYWVDWTFLVAAGLWVLTYERRRWRASGTFPAP